MPTVNQRLFAPVQLGTGLATLFTAAGKVLIDSLTLCNTTGGTITGVELHIVPSGGGASTTTMVISNRSLLAAETYRCPELVGHTLENGEFVQARAGTGASISARGSGRVTS
jgi:hypothetical protein